MMAAGGRGWHLFNHGPRAVFHDWLGWPLVGGEVEPLLEQVRGAFGDTTRIATWLAGRSRITEEWLSESGAKQYVLLGAGLDSFAWRQDGEYRVFEVDIPASQAWKQARLEAMDVSTPPGLVWVGIDFETESIRDRLADAGLDTDAPVFVSWLGVTAYLSLDAIQTTLAELPACRLAVSYGTEDDAWDEETTRVSNIFRHIAADAGEGLVSQFTTEAFAELLAQAGFQRLQDFGAEDVEPRYGAPATANVGERVSLAEKP